ncbi:tyrosine-type recombinase/integrase [Brevundimonas sp. TWP2-3-4b1]|uniref:tyrosine-type recombinase/integrase n=1 Tax=Brevundimonas sp. TWP2-3-4b1 TaxID=2804580 RepID=UPI003CE69D8E
MGLSTLEIKHAKSGMHADGGGLYLSVNKAGAKSWIFRYQVAGRRREMGLGSLSALSVTQVRARAEELRDLTRSGADPLEQRKQAAIERARAAAEQVRQLVGDAKTFDVVATEYIRAHSPGWRNAKHAKQWGSTLQTYAYPLIGQLPVQQVTTGHLLGILQPIWSKKPETASRVRARVELVISYAKARGWFQGENPAIWRGHLDALLPLKSRVKAVRHHPALEWRLMADFMARLSAMPGISARALAFTVLTAARSGEVRNARWREIDLSQKIWTVPAARMKAKKEHRVALSNDALTLLSSLPRIQDAKDGEDTLLFPSAQAGRALSDMSLLAVIRRMDRGEGTPPITVHGFRSSFRDWASEATFHHPDLVELALAHTIGNKVEAAYRRGDMFEKRRALMEDWAAWCRGEGKADVQPE